MTIYPAGLPRHVATIVAFVTIVASGCASPPQRTNFERCLDDDYTCNSALLDAEETRRLIEVRRPQHFLDCLAGRRCNESILDEAERRQVRQALGQRNFEACLKGEAECRRDQLADSQRAQVEQAGGMRNFMYCVSGLSACEKELLTEDQRAAARDAYLQRNFAGCMNSVGTLLRCRQDDLSVEQLELVQRRNVAVNFYICSNALIGCNDALLTPEQRVALQKRQ